MTDGPTVAMNDMFVGIVVFIGKLVVSIVMLVVGVLLAREGPPEYTAGLPQAAVISGMLCCLFGYAVVCIAMTLVEAGNKTVMVCWLENPNALATSHQGEFDKMKSIWVGLGRDVRAKDRDAKLYDKDNAEDSD